MNELWFWLTLALLGAYHGLNPAMGWLFAVALGLQERCCAVVLRAFALLASISHPRWVGIRVNIRDLTVCSFLMATAHGAGLMLVPVLLRLSGGNAQAAHDMAGH